MSDISNQSGGALAGIIAQFNSLLQILTRIAASLGAGSPGAVYNPLVWSGAGNLTVSTEFPNATTGTIIIDQVTPAALTVTLPSTGGPWIVVDGAGVAAANHITINAAGGRTINGGSSVSITTNYGSDLLLLNGGNYLSLL